LVEISHGFMKTTNIIIQARMGSARLPGKSMMSIWNDVSLFELVVMRLVKSRLPSRVILATSSQANDDILIPIAKKWKIDVFRGDEKDVLGRFVGALEMYPSDGVVRACADNPLLDPEMVDNLISFFWDSQPCNYAMNLGPKTGYPDGVGVEMVLSQTLRALNEQVNDAFNREHVLTYIHNNPDFISKYIMAPAYFQRPHYRLDIDYPEDMEFVRRLVARLPHDNAPYWTTADIISALDEIPELLSIRKKRDQV
jgi:spore coat polysaccharide biosynthesis protein SpsF (cytidylyltransferase family)